MPSSFMVKRNYANCPLKKRPLALYNQPAIAEQEQPEDLSVKRPRLDAPTPVAAQTGFLPYVPTVSQSMPSVAQCQVSATMAAPELPTLAEYYLQLFRATSDAETRHPTIAPRNPHPTSGPLASTWHTPYLPLSPQPSPGTDISPPVHPVARYPESSALISPVSTCSSNHSEDELEEELQGSRQRREARYSCSDCSKSYSTYSGLSKHKQFHCLALGAKSFECKHCDKMYTSLGALKMHIRTHTLPCKCHLCGKAFSRPWLLQGHIRTHTGEKPFGCPQCDRSFADRSNLRAHLQTHAHVKRYACVQCHKTFSRMSLLNKHNEGSCLRVSDGSVSPSSSSDGNL